MRIFLLAALAASALAGPAGAATRNFGIASFTKVRVEGPYRVRVATGVPPYARASGSPSGIDRVTVELRGDTLVVKSNPGWGGYPGTDTGPVEVSIGTHDLERASLMGAGAIAIDKVKGLSFALTVQGSGTGEIGSASADRLDVTLIGTANAKVAGKAEKLSALVRGTSSLDASALDSSNAAISADGTATVSAKVSDTAKVDAWGPAQVTLTGQPSCELKVSGSTSVSGCKASH